MRPFGHPPLEGVAEVVKAGVLEVPSAVRILTINDAGLVGVQLEADGTEPLGYPGEQLAGLSLAVAMDD